MKLLLTTDTVGGVWTYAIDLARGLRPFGVHVALATMGAPLRPDQQAQAGSLDNVTVYESAYRLEWMQDPWDDVRGAGEWLLGIARDFAADVVHLNGYAHASLPWHSPVVVVGHSCVLSWWQAVKGDAAPAEWDRYRDEVTRGLRSADLVVAPTAATLAELRRLYGPLGDSGVIYNGRDASPFHSAKKEPFVLSAGRLWDEAKNLAALERIAPRLPWPVYVAGDEHGPDGAAAGAAPRQTRPLGRLDEAAMADWLARAAVYALPARYEPFGLSALEAALSGCALVLGDIGSLREVWGEAALFVPPGDHDALSGAIRWLTDSPARRSEMGERARFRAARYAPQRMAEQYLAAYRRLIRGGRSDSSSAAPGAALSAGAGAVAQAAVPRA